jgi:hypothetical protein
VLLSIPLSALGVAFGIGVVTAFSPAKTAAENAAPSAEPSTAQRVDSVPSPEAPALAPADDLARASKEGLSALDDLGDRFPMDARIPLAKSGQLLRNKDVEGAVHAMDRALQLDPALAEDAQIASALWIAVQNKQGSKAAFALLAGRMGKRGRAILEDLATTPGVKPPIREEAKRALARP